MRGSKPLYLATVADVHGKKYFTLFVKALNEIRELRDNIIAFVFAGDIVLKGDVNSAYDTIKVTLNFMQGKPVLACIGNEEYDSILDSLFKKYNDIIWLNDERCTLSVNGLKAAIIGSRGSLDRPTSWQRRNIPGIERIYIERISKLKKLITKAKEDHDVVILVTHYAPTFKTLKGEPPRIWSEMGSTRLEKAIIEVKPHIVVHGHAHNSKVLQTEIDGVRVYNVALPATKRITLINLREVIVKGKPTTLLDYFKV